MTEHRIEPITTDTARRKAGQLVARVEGVSPSCLERNTFLADAFPAELQIRDSATGSTLAVICSRAPGQHVESFIAQFGLDVVKAAENLAATCTQLEYLAVAPRVRNQGLDELLLAAAETIHTDAGTIWWYTFQRSDSPLLPLLTSHGWTATTSKDELPDVFRIFDLAIVRKGTWLFKQLNPTPEFLTAAAEEQ